MADPLIGLTFTFDAPATRERERDQAPRGGLGSQVLPVAELDDEWEGEPGDGSEYLFLVRREASTHARVLRVANPFVTMEVDVEAAVAQQEEDDEPPASRPDEAWRKVFVRNFEAARQRMLAAPKSSLPPADPALIPKARDEGAWRVFINGKRSKPNSPAAKKAVGTAEDELAAAKRAVLASLDLDDGETSLPATSTARPEPAPVPTPPPSGPAPEYERLPQLPSPALLVSIPRPYLIHVLSHFDDWYNERLEQYEEKLNFVPSTIFAPPALRRKGAMAKPATPAAEGTKAGRPRPPLPSAHESHWMLSLLTRLEQVLDGEDLATLRQLARTLRSLAEESHKVSVETRVAAGTGRSMQQRTADEKEAEGRARCWMVVAAVANVWKQGDLWDPRL
ncbi:hypothetical protein JCM10296v2_004123 [Rhodotorula toruloides]